MNNLKVNSKTTIEEFKRKHNLLVDSSIVQISGETNITGLSDEILDSLKCGDVVAKKTGNQEHCYIVTYKEEKHGICLSYFNAGYTETVSYDYTANHWVYNSTDISECNKLENITDKDGHKRFIEGNIILPEIEGITYTYAKWSLSGTHLMIVVAGNMVEGFTTSWISTFATINIPYWILNKIYPMNGDTVSQDVFTIVNEDNSTQNLTCFLRKTNTLFISTGSITANKDRAFRISFDLLIDNEEPVGD